jgi:hypothetical protein
MALPLMRGWSLINCCNWASSLHSFLGLSPTGHVTLFYCLNFETHPTWRFRFLYLVPQEQGTPVEMQSKSKSNLSCNRQSACLSWYQATIWDQRPIFFFSSVEFVFSSCGFFPYYGAPLLTRGWNCHFFNQRLWWLVLCQYLHECFILYV